MIKLLFVCHGNICRSPMAEFVMKDLVQKAGLAEQFHIESAATSTEEIGCSVYQPARNKLAEHGIRCDGKTARQLRRADYKTWDLLIGMDRLLISSFSAPAASCATWRRVMDALRFTFVRVIRPSARARAR